MKKIILILCLALVSMFAYAQQTGTFKDIRDGKVYKTVKIGTRWFFAENLAYKPNSNRYLDQNNDTSFVSKYGYLYTWDDAKGSCPKGWHVPSKKEWETLFDFLGGDKTIMYDKLKEGGSSGFNVKLCGFGADGTRFLGAGSVTFFWSSTPTADKGSYYFRCSSDGITALYVEDFNHISGYSVRPIKD